MGVCGCVCECVGGCGYVGGGVRGREWGCGRGLGGVGVYHRRGLKECSLEQLNKFLPFSPQFPHL